MEENQFVKIGKEILTDSSKLSVEDLINAPSGGDNDFILPFNSPDLSSTIKSEGSSSNKIKVLSIPSDKTGVGKYRSIDPHKMLNQLFKDEFFVEINPAPNYEDDEYFKNFDIVHIHKAPSGNYERGLEIVLKIQSLGCKVIIDNDDYWAVGSFSPHYYSMKKYKVNEKLLDIVKAADWVTTTTPIFANEIRKYNKNVFVIPNAIDPDEPQFKTSPIESDKIRVGYLGGSSHLEDLRLIESMCNRLIIDKDKMQLVLIGFDLRGTIYQMDKNGKKTQRAMTPKETVWYQYEKMFTSNYLLVNDYPEYSKYLQRYVQEPFNGSDINMPYRRLWTRDINNYAKNYNNLDISLAPLVENKFNSLKSQLKVVEAGFYKKALIAQNFGPYTLDLINIVNSDGTINESGNAYLIDSHKNHKQWYQAVKKLINNPELIKLMGENLYNTVKDKYDLKIVTKLRADFYKSIV